MVAAPQSQARPLEPSGQLRFQSGRRRAVPAQAAELAGTKSISHRLGAAIFRFRCHDADHGPVGAAPTQVTVPEGHPTSTLASYLKL